MNKALPSPTEPKLTKRQERFLDELVANGGNLEEAAISAGYSIKSARTAANHNMRLTHVQQALEARLTRKLKVGKALAIKTLESVARHGFKDAARVAAANAILDRAEKLEGLAKGNNAGISISINMRSDTGATQPTVIIDQHADEQGQITQSEGDDASD